MNQEQMELVANEEAVVVCDLQVRELSEAQLAFVGGGIGDVIAG